MPALPLGQAGKYVALAYVVLLTLLAVYVAVMSHKLKRSERRLSELDRTLRDRNTT